MAVLLDSVVLAWLVWMAANPILMALSNDIGPVRQAAILTHREVGLCFVGFLILYCPAHLFLAKGPKGWIVSGSFSSAKPFAFLILAFWILFFAWGLSKYLSVAICLGAILTFERSRPGRGRDRRFLDVLIGLVLIFVLLTASADRLVKFFFFLVGLYTAYRLVRFSLRFLRQSGTTVDLWGRIGVYLAFLAGLFSPVAQGARYAKSLAATQVLHDATSYALVLVVGLHVAAQARRIRASGDGRMLVSPAAMVLAFSVLLAWEVLSVSHYRLKRDENHDVGSIHFGLVSPYAGLKGFRLSGEDRWFESPSKSCATRHCHPKVVQQHDLSAHGRAFDNSVFQWQLREFISDKGRTAADYCLACHAPLAVINHPGDGSHGDVLDPLTTEDPCFTVGVGCVVCHRATPEMDQTRMGNASLTIRPLWLESDTYLFEGMERRARVTRFLMLAASSLHKRTYRIGKAEADSVCGACHVVFLPARLSVDDQTKKVADHYTSFRESPYAKAGLGCVSCHMPRFRNWADGYLMSDHHYLGPGTSLPYDEGDREYREISDGFLAGLGDVTLDIREENQLPPCLSSLETAADSYAVPKRRGPMHPFKGRNGGVAHRDLLATALREVTIEDGSVTLRVETRNECSGHSFPPGGGIKGFLEIKAFDREGKVVGRNGGLGPEGLPAESPTNLGSQVADVNGKVISDRKFWKAHTLRSARFLDPGQTVEDVVTMKLAEGSRPEHVEATWYYIRPEAFRNRERGIQRDVPPFVVGRATWTLPDPKPDR